MKKLVLIAIMSLVPFTAFALDAMNDSALDQITAQEGVSITFDNVVINQAAMETAWMDSDGIASVPGGGYIFLSQSSGNTIKLNNTTMEIDVATTTTAWHGVPADTTFISIKLPSVTIGATQRLTEITLDDTITALLPVPDAGVESLGTLYENTTGDTTISGNVYIYAH